MDSNVLGLLASYGFVFGILLLGEGIRKVWRLSPEFTRKFVHIGVGNWYILALLFFTNKVFALIPPLTFIVLNYASYRWKIFKAMELPERGNLGTVYFPISLSILVWLTWDTAPYLGGVGIMAMTWGDGFAAIVGQNWGRRVYSVFGNRKSIEGSLAMFFFSFLAIALFLNAFSPLPFATAVLQAILLAGVAAGVEALSGAGLDNILVPLLTSGAAFIL
ncbi:MAG TPA: phosphatidate cytidylyltransferase [Firmicutes bacterium]|nr:phosphatidate cytidylyltransferase [Bacillota bacterium]